MRIVKLPSGSYYAQVMIDGKRYSITKKTQSAVMKAAEDLKKGKRATDKGKTVKEVVDEFIHDREAVLSPSTISAYKAMLRVRFLNTQERKVESMNDRQWQIAISDEAKKVSPKTVKNAWGLFSSSLAYGGYDVPKVKLPQMIHHEHEWLEPEQIPLFLKSIKGKKIEIPALFALHGLRKSEILALDWSKIDLDKKTITVSGAVVKNADKKYVLKQTNKNATSTRIVPIMIQRLEEALKETDKDKPLIIYRPSSIYKAINDACEEAGLPKVGVHGLRHSAVSLAYSLGMNELTCMRLFGYADYTTMRKIYTHLANKDLDDGVEGIRQFFK